MNFSELIYPMTRKTFYEKIKGKRYHVWKSKNNRFKDYFSWTELDNVTRGQGKIVSAIENRQGLKIACLEEIAFNHKWINKKNLKEAIRFYGNCEYSKYLTKLF